ncbi:Ger(x)C family spore germination protein [Gorillibacterium sp. sgz5001074]|uniref:Ger(x)C family spore germination protein n=1 Tax=Gorillibacterium sp. sgz5001074 TaxID=3446695 RepID=UPI003F6618E8
MIRTLSVSALILLLLTGCWNRREPEQVDYVVAVGIDIAEDGKLALTIQSPTLEAMKPRGAGQEEKVKTISVKGETAFQAIRNYIRAAGRKLFWGHTQIYVLGEEAAKAGVEKYLDFFSMDPELRGTSQIAVVKGKAKDVMESKTQFTSIPANYLAELIKNSVMVGNAANVNFADFNRMLAEPAGGQPYLPVMKLMEQSEYDKKVAGIKSPSSSGPEQSPIVYTEGTAVFRDSKLTGFLNERETRGLLWANQMLKSTIVAVPSGDGNSRISLELIGGLKSRKEVSIEGGRAHLKLYIKANVNIGDRNSSFEHTDDELLVRLEEGFAKIVREEVEAAYSKASVKLHSDIMGFGNALADQNPKLWKQVKGDWEEELLPDAKLEVKVEGTIRRTSRTLYSPWAKGTE